MSHLRRILAASAFAATLFLVAAIAIPSHALVLLSDSPLSQVDASPSAGSATNAAPETVATEAPAPVADEAPAPEDPTAPVAEAAPTPVAEAAPAQGAKDASSSSPEAALPSADGLQLRPLEASLLKLLNDERVAHGVPPLSLSRELVVLARERSEDMAARDYFSHVTPEGEMVFKMMDARGIHYRLAGENLARNNYPPEKSPTVAHEGFMNSPAHAENELEPTFDEIGIGTAERADGTIFFTELFLDVN